MAERTNIPGSPACGQWETLLADALDGTLRTEDESTFSSHMAGCAACTALFEEARRGREWLDFLSAEPELPEGLLERILAQTGPGQAAGYGLVPDTGTSSIAGVPLAIVTPKWQRPGFLGVVRRFAEPRLMMTVAMAFFSIALTLNLTGVKLSQIRMSDLKPDGGAVVCAAAHQHGFHAHRPLLRPPPAGVRGAGPGAGDEDDPPRPRSSRSRRSPRENRSRTTRTIKTGARE